MSNIIGRFLFAGLIATSIFSPLAIYAHDSAAEKVALDEKACEDLLASVIKKFEEQTSAPAGGLFVDQIIANDRPQFTELIDPDPKKNLFARAPLTAMSGAQRVLSFVLSGGVEHRKVAFLAEPVITYPFLVDGTDATQGYRVEGNWRAMADLVSFMKAQAEGDRSGRTVPIAFGPGGTGKSEARTVIEKGAEVLTINNPDYFVYSFDWIRVNELPEMVKRWGPDVDIIAAPRNTSPIAILPPQFQEQALKMAALKGQSLLKGIRPNHSLRPDAWSRTILKFIIEHYTQKKGSALTLNETLQAIARHVRIRRTVMSSTYRQFPIVNVQGIEADHSQLFISSNPVVQAISPEGKMDPFAYSYSGLVFQGDGNMTIFEEMTRSAPNFLEKMMDGFESRELQMGGAAKEPWDSFVMGISNKESYDNLMAKGGLSALRQRFQLIEMTQPSQPQLVARTILYGYKDNLWMKPIGDENAEWVKGDLNALYPIPEKLEPGHVKGPERRYRMRIGQGDRAVEISPHALRFMAWIIATTRFETDKEKAYSLVQTRLVHDNLFTDPIHRIRFWDGKLTDIQPEERRTLDEMTNKMGEGHNGIVHRNALGWMRAAIELVRQDSRFGMTLTPSVLLKVFEEEGFRTDGFIQTNDPGQEGHYKRLGRLVLRELLVPAVRDDINFAYSAGQGDISAIYQDVLQELLEDDRTDGSATEYTSRRTNRVQRINKERLQFVKDYYSKQTGRKLPMQQIMFFHMNQLQDGKKSVEPSPEIAGALAAYMAKKTLDAANATGLADTLRSGSGSKETQTLANDLIKHLEQLGYNRAAALDAFDLEQLANQPSQTADQPQ